MKRKNLLITLSLIVISATLTFVSCALPNVTNKDSRNNLQESDKDDTTTEESTGTSSQEIEVQTPYSDDDMIRYTDKELVSLLGPGKEEITDSLGIKDGGKTIEYNDTKAYFVINSNGEYNSYYIKTKSNKLSHLRGIKIGDSVNSVISKFSKGNTNDKEEMKASIFGKIDGVTSYSLCYGSKNDDINRGIIGYDSAGNIKAAKYTTEISATTFIFENNTLSEIQYYELIN